MDREFVKSYFKTISRTLLKHMFDKAGAKIWNMVEIGIFLDYKPMARSVTKCLHSGSRENKELITVIAAVNADGAKTPPHMIPNGKTIRALNSFELNAAPNGTIWSVSDRGWTKQGIAKL